MKGITCVILVGLMTTTGIGIMALDSPTELAILPLPFDDGFENIAVGEYPSANGWFMDFHGRTGHVTDEQASEGNNSFKQTSMGWARTDAVRVDMPDHLIYSVDVYVDSMSGNAVWVGFHEKLSYSSSYIFNFVMFNTQRDEIRAKGEKLAPSILLQPFSADVWYNVMVDINFANNSIDFYIDGVLRAGGIVPEPKATSNTFVLGSSDVPCYFDEVHISESEAQVDPLVFLNDLRTQIEQLPDDSFLKNPDQRRNALLNKVDAVEDLISNGNYTEAIDKLQNDIRGKMDGLVDGMANNDWIIDHEAQLSLTGIIDELVLILQT